MSDKVVVPVDWPQSEEFINLLKAYRKADGTWEAVYYLKITAYLRAKAASLIAAAPSPEPAEQRTAGNSPLRGRPLDENGGIAFEPAESAAPAMMDAEIDSVCIRLLRLAQAGCQTDAAKIAWAEKVNAIRIAAKERKQFSAEPWGWMIQLADSQYPVDDLDDAQALDDLTNSNAVAIPLHARTGGK